jgi:hypothetical protein
MKHFDNMLWCGRQRNYMACKTTLNYHPRSMRTDELCLEPSL